MMVFSELLRDNKVLFALFPFPASVLEEPLPA